MTAYVHINLRVIDPARQASLAPRFQAALERAGGRIVHFGPVEDHLEGDVVPLPLAGVFAFRTLDDARAFAREDRLGHMPRQHQMRGIGQGRGQGGGRGDFGQDQHPGIFA